MYLCFVKQILTTNNNNNMKKKILMSAALLVSSIFAFAQFPGGGGFGGFGGFGGGAPGQEAIPEGATKIMLWGKGKNKAPNDNHTTDPRDIGFEPFINVYPAENPNGLAVLCLPGGGYAVLSKSQEGYGHAKWFNDQGITFILLEYRMPHTYTDVPLSDVKQAWRIIMKHADEWGIKKLGVMGSSAGGHLASTAATHYDEDTRPDFQILFYPVISMDKSITHLSSHDLLLGEDASEELEREYSNNLKVTPQTPPAFIIHSTNDPLVPVKNSLLYYEALVENKVPATMMIYPVGGHGYGCGDFFAYKKELFETLAKWLDTQK